MNNTPESNQPAIALPPSADLPAPLPLNLPLPNWLLAILLLSAMTNRLYQVSLVILSIVQTWKKSDTDKDKTE
jgi:hypothetical protein